MDFGLFVIFVTLASIIYSAIIRVVQMKTGNQAEMQVLQAESKLLNEEYKRASERKDQRKMDEIMQKQMELFPKMNKLMMGQFKTFIPVILVFLVFTWVIGAFDPTIKDDFTVQLNDNGLGCDKLGGDLIYSGCLTLNNSNHGVWNVHALFSSSDNSINIENSTSFLFVDNSSSYVYHREKGLGLLDGFFGKTQPSFYVSTGEQTYKPGEEISIYATSSIPGNATAVLDSGTMFVVPLPVVEFKIFEAYWWFIGVAFISGFAINAIMNKFKKQEKKAV